MKKFIMFLFALCLGAFVNEVAAQSLNYEQVTTNQTVKPQTINVYQNIYGVQSPLPSQVIKETPGSSQLNKSYGVYNTYLGSPEPLPSKIIQKNGNSWEVYNTYLGVPVGLPIQSILLE